MKKRSVSYPSRRMTKAEAQAWKKRWEAVSTAEREELCHTSVEKKFRQLATLMASVEELGWIEALASEEAPVRDLWNRLRKACNA